MKKKKWTRKELDNPSNYYWEALALSSQWNAYSKWHFIQMMRDDLKLVWC